MTKEQKEEARRIRRELAEELSKKKPDPAVIERLRREIIKNGTRIFANATVD